MRIPSNFSLCFSWLIRSFVRLLVVDAVVVVDYSVQAMESWPLTVNDTELVITVWWTCRRCEQIWPDEQWVGGHSVAALAFLTNKPQGHSSFCTTPHCVRMLLANSLSIQTLVGRVSIAFDLLSMLWPSTSISSRKKSKDEWTENGTIP